MIIARASSLPRIIACPASAKKPEVEIDTAGDAAAMGRAVHEVMEIIVANGWDSLPSLRAWAFRYGVDEGELVFLCHRGMEVWKRYRPHLDAETIRCEAEAKCNLSPTTQLTGHIDLIARMANDPGTVVIIDWKTGYVERDHRHQLMGYALLALMNVTPAPERFKIVTCWLRTFETDTLDMDCREVVNFSLEIANALADAGCYAPHESYCIYCPRSHECPAKSLLVREAVNSLLPSKQNTRDMTDRDKLAALYDSSRTLTRTLEQYTEALKNTLRENGALQLPDGRYLTLQECQRDTIKLNPVGLESLKSSLEVTTTDSVLDALGPEAVTIQKKALLAAAGLKAPCDKKKDAREHAMQALRDAGCVTTSMFDKIVPILHQRKIEKEPEHGLVECGS